MKLPTLKSPYITAIISVSIVAGWILLLLPAIANDSLGRPRELWLSRVSSEDWGGGAKFGAFDWGGQLGLTFYIGQFAEGTSRLNTRSGAPGYEALLSLSVINPQSLWDEERQQYFPPLRDHQLYKVLGYGDTAPLVLFPITLGLLGLAFIAFLIGDVRKNLVWRSIAAFLGIVSAVLGWTAWGFAFAMTDTMNKVLTRYNESRYAWYHDFKAERGTAIWPSLVGAIIVTFSAGGMLWRAIWGPRRSKRVKRQETSLPDKEAGDICRTSDQESISIESR